MSELDDPQFDWKDAKTPLSQRFDDVYFSAVDGLAESRYVFVEGCGFPDGFAGREHVCIAETGFGTGLNFLLTWQAWEQAEAPCSLHYISVEGFPLDQAALAAAHETFPSLAPYAAALQEAYPPTQGGFHHLSFAGGKVRLTLLFGMAADVLAQVDGQVDAWYLDGFAPAKNPEMWQEAVFQQIGRLSHQGTVLSTFTAAGFVKRGLQAVGFDMRKRKGFGRKRESLIGVFEKEARAMLHPWFALPAFSPDQQSPKKVAVIGAGIAGCVTATRLQQEGHEVHVFERKGQAGQGASGNPLGLISPRLALDQNSGAHFNTMAYLQAVRFYQGEWAADLWSGTRGIFQMAKDEDDVLRQQQLVTSKVLPDSHMIFLTAEQASAQLGHGVARGGLWFPHAGAVRPAQICQTLAASLKVHYNKVVDTITPTGQGQWVLQGQDGVYDAVVLTTAGELAHLVPQMNLPLNGRRGQINFAQLQGQDVTLKHGANLVGYVIPDGQQDYVMGASFEPWANFYDLSYQDVDDKSTQHNLKQFAQSLPDQTVEVTSGRASIRAMTPDHLPIVGPVMDNDKFRSHFAPLAHGPKAAQKLAPCYEQGLYVMTGLGARGIQTAPLLADILSSYINGQTAPVQRKIREALHPARFLVRDLIKGR